MVGDGGYEMKDRITGRPRNDDRYLDLMFASLLETDIDATIASFA